MIHSQNRRSRDYALGTVQCTTRNLNTDGQAYLLTSHATLGKLFNLSLPQRIEPTSRDVRTAKDLSHKHLGQGMTHGK